jgi:hypothetical protein
MNLKVAHVRFVSTLITGVAVMAAMSALAVVVTPTPASLYDLFPKDTQGTNGIRLQYRAEGVSTYTDLSYASDYTWNTPANSGHYNLPFVIRSGTAGRIVAEPFDTATQPPLDPVIRVQVQSSFSRIRVQGTAGQTGGSVNWYIYKGASNWAAPLWQSSSAASFDFEVDCAPGEELFFAVNAAGFDASDHSYWQDLRLTAVAFPISATPSSVYDLFPRDTQGTNGLRLQNRVPGTSTYGDMSHLGDYSWGTPAYHYNFPTLIREGTAGQLLAQPYGDFMTGNSLDSVLRVQVDGACARVRVQGSAAYTFSFAALGYRIYQGATNWANPLWSADKNGGSFDFEVVCFAGDELFFTVTSGGDDRGVQPRWNNLTLTGIPPTLTAYTAIELGWSTVTNRWYQLQYCTNIASPNWQAFGSNWLGTGTNLFTFDSCRYSTQRYYRVVELP